MRSISPALITRLLLLPALLGSAGVAFAHDFWVRPTNWTPEVNNAVLLELCVGDHFLGETRPRDEAYVTRFVVRHGETVGDVKALPGRAEPAGFFKPEAKGVHFIGYEGKPRYLELDGVKFTSYLREAGLTEVIEARSIAGTTREPGREEYARCAKSLIKVGQDSQWTADRPFGLTLELVALTDPDASGAFRVQLLRAGKAVVGASIVCHQELVPTAPGGVAPSLGGSQSGGSQSGGAPSPRGTSTPDKTLRVTQDPKPVPAGQPPQDPPPVERPAGPPTPRTAKTDASGIAEFTLNPDTNYLFTAIQMRAATSPKATDPAAPDKPLEWSSHWASLTLRTAATAR